MSWPPALTVLASMSKSEEVEKGSKPLSAMAVLWEVCRLGRGGSYGSVSFFSTSLFPEQRECRWNTWNRNSWFFLVMNFISLWIKKKKKKEDSVKQKYWHGSHRSGKDRHLRESICSFSPYSLSFGGSFMWLRILIYVLNTMEMFENGLRFLLLLILMSCFQFCS